MAGTVKSQTDCSVLLLGAGYTARALIPVLQKRGYEVVGTTRSEAKAKALSQSLGVKIIDFGGDIGADLASVMTHTTHVISSIPPADDGVDPVITALGTAIESGFSRLRWAGYLSATSVYGDRNGQWVFEDEYLYPKTDRGRNRVLAELAWLESGLPVHVFRLAGIYGPDLFGQSRNPFSRIQSGKARAVIKPGHVVNRIHVQDIVSAVLASMDQPDPGQVYNIADGHPAPPQDVLNFAADLINAPRPPEVRVDDPGLSDMAKSFYTETKCVDITKGQRLLNWTPKYPNYQVGLRDIFDRDYEKSVAAET